MARVTCAISGIRFECEYFHSISIGWNEGYFHPIFSLPRKRLYYLYKQHTTGELTPTDSYLLFLSLLHSSEKITWEHPAICNPNEQRTKQLVHNNIAQLIRVLEKSDVIKHPGFKQPKFRITLDTAHLHQIPQWIKAWEDNIVVFNSSRAAFRHKMELQEVENRLSEYIHAGARPENYAHVVANWACEAAGFPDNKEESWKQIIRSCFNPTKMFNTPLESIKELKEYCLSNIQAGSVHFHILCEVIKNGIALHHDYLGTDSSILGYEILPTLSTGSQLEDAALYEESKKKIEELADNAPETEPARYDYPTELAYIKAKLAFRLAKNRAKNEAREAAAQARKQQMNIPIVYDSDNVDTSIPPANQIDIDGSL